MILTAALAMTVLTADASVPERTQGLVDARLVNIRDGAADLWLALEVQPDAFETASGADWVAMTMTGGTCQPREIIPPAGRPVTRITLAPDGEASCAMRIDGAWQVALPRLAEGGVIVALDGIVLAPVVPVVAAVAQPAQRYTSGPNQGTGDQTGQTLQTGAGGEETGSAGRGATGAPTALAATPGGLCAETATRLEDTPWDLAAMSAHGDCLGGEGRTSDAQTLYERVLAFEPGHFAAALGLAQIRAEAGDIDTARALFETAAAAARTDGEALAARSAAEALGVADE